MHRFYYGLTVMMLVTCVDIQYNLKPTQLHEIHEIHEIHGITIKHQAIYITPLKRRTHMILFIIYSIFMESLQTYAYRMHNYMCSTRHYDCNVS